MFSNRSSKSGKREFGKRRTVVQLEDEPRRQPTYGFGYKPAEEVQKPEVSGNALSGIMSQYAMDSPSDDNSGDDDVGSPSNGPPPSQETQKDNKKWPKFVAATDTQLPTFKAADASVSNDKSKPPVPPVPSGTGVSSGTGGSSGTSVTSGTGVSGLTSASSGTVASSGTGISSGTGGSSGTGVSGGTGPVGDDIDLKLKDFLAEIESIDVPENPSVEEVETKADEKETSELKPPEPKPEPKPADPAADSDADNGIGTSEDDANNPPVEPKEPTSIWQHCLDEGTQCYYYWNIDTNEVTWESPPDFSQYLLRYKEYERLLAKYEKEMAEWKKLHGGRKTKKSTKKERKHRKKVEDKEVIEPLVSYPPIPEEEEEPEMDEAAPLIYGPQKPPDDVLEKLLESKPITEDATPSSMEPQPLHSEPKEKATKNHVALSDIEKPAVDGSSTSKKHHRSKSSKHGTEPENVEVEKIQDSKSHDSEVRSFERKVKSQDRDAKAISQSSPIADGGDVLMSVLTGPVDDGKTSGASTKVLPEVRDELVPDGEAKVEELEDEDDFVNRELEEPIFTHYEYVNKKYEEEQNDDSVDIGIDDIDRELELALERRMNKTEAGFGSKKRKHEFLGKDLNSEVKRQKTEVPVDDLVSSAWKTSSIRNEIKTKVDELAQVLDLVTTVLEKLEFLEVSQSCLSKLQVLLVQTQTRLEDWKAGGLSTCYMLQRLQESAATLQQYELNASPPGWSCLWDRTFKRYFYCNNISGENSWAYPEVVGVDAPLKQRSHGTEGTMSPYRDAALMDEPEQRYHGATSSQAATDGTLLVHLREPSETGSDNALPIPSDLLTWAANPPPPPPATPPPPPSPSQNSEPFSTSDMDFDSTVAVDDQPVDPSTESRTEVDQEDEGALLEEEPVPPVTEPQLPPTQISAPPMITKPVVQQQQPPASTHKDGVANVTVSAVASPDASAATVPPPSVTSQEGPYDGEPMEDPAAAGSHPVKEKKKKKEKSMLGGGLAMKKKNVSSLVEKWQKIQVDFSKEDEKEINRQKKLAELAAKASSASASSKTTD